MELGITGLKKIYGTRQVLSIPRLTVSSGLITAVAGANGAGKTTLLNLLAGLERKDGGEILYDGREEPPFSEMTMVFQEPYLISGTVRKNIAWPMKIRKISRVQIKERVEELAEELLDYVLAVASGRKVKSEEAGFHDMAIFKQGVTL